MTLRVQPQTEDAVEDLVRSGHYADVDDVIAQAIELLRRRDAHRRLVASVQESLAQADRGEVFELTEEFMEEIMQEAIEANRLGLPIDPDVCP